MDTHPEYECIRYIKNNCLNGRVGFNVEETMSEKELLLKERICSQYGYFEGKNMLPIGLLLKERICSQYGYF